MTRAEVQRERLRILNMEREANERYNERLNNCRLDLLMLRKACKHPKAARENYLGKNYLGTPYDSSGTTCKDCGAEL